jgi:hypothetical protein
MLRAKTSAILANNFHCCRTRQAVKGRENYRQREKQILDDILGKGYDKRIRPSGKNYTGIYSAVRMRKRSSFTK